MGTAAQATPRSSLCRAITRASNNRAPAAPCVHTRSKHIPSQRALPAGGPFLAPAGPCDQVCCSLSVCSATAQRKRQSAWDLHPLEAARFHEQTVQRDDNGGKANRKKEAALSLRPQKNRTVIVIRTGLPRSTRYRVYLFP